MAFNVKIMVMVSIKNEVRWFLTEKEVLISGQILGLEQLNNCLIRFDK